MSAAFVASALTRQTTAADASKSDSTSRALGVTSSRSHSAAMLATAPTRTTHFTAVHANTMLKMKRIGSTPNINTLAIVSHGISLCAAGCTRKPLRPDVGYTR